MASTPASSEVDPEEDTGTVKFGTQKTGRAAEYPDFAIIWSFLENFRHLLHFPDLSLDDLEDGFNSHNSENGNVLLIEELFKKLLRRIGVSVNPERWEKSLLKVTKEHGLVCAWDLEQFGYQELEVSSKLDLFKVLLECQFDQNEKLKSSVNKGFDAEDLRMQPIGRDLDGFIYWYHEDDCNGVRLYTTEEDEVNCESWKLLAGETDELVAVVEFLESKSEVNPKEIALEKRKEMKKKRDIKSPGKKKGKKGKKKGDVVEEDYDDDNPCARCFSNVRPDSILLCDKCDAAYHTACLRPPLLTVPQGDWFCPFCQQLALLEVLKEKKTRIAARMKLRQRQAKRLGFAGIDLNNILQKASDDEEDQGIRRSGRSRKNVDYTFREFEDDITSAVENDKKRFKGEEVNGEDQGLLYSKPAYETGRLLGTGQRNTRRSRRLMDLDYESDSESRTSGFEYEGNSEEESQQSSTWHGNLRRKRRIINEDDEDDGSNNDVGNENTKDLKVTETGQEAECDNVKEGKGSDAKVGESVVDKKQDSDDRTEEKPDGKEEKTLEENKNATSEKAASLERESKGGVNTTATTAPSQNAAPLGNKIHPHSRIATVAPVARNPPVANVKNYRTPPDYPPEGVFPHPPNFDMLKAQLPTKQAPNYLTPNFGASNVTTSNIPGNNFTEAGNLHSNSAPGVLQGGPSFPGAQQVPNVRTNFGGPSFPGTNFNFPNTNFGGQDGTNFGGSFVGGMNNFGPGVGANFGGTSNFGRNNATVSGMGDLSGMKSRPHTQNVPGSIWGGQNDFNSMYNYQQFPQQSGTTPVALSAPAKTQTLPPPYPSGGQFVGNRQYGGYNQQVSANSNIQSNYMTPQQSGNFPDANFFPAPPQQPPPPYTANSSQNANFYANTSQEGGSLAGNQWTYPEGYGYYPAQGSTAGQSF